jgi:chemotaxis protein methyltransferase CheR
MPISSSPEMTPEEFRLVGEQLVGYAGLLFREEMKYLLERRLAPRLAALGLADFGAYYRYLRYDVHGRAELALATELLVTHETYFFREMGQLQAFSQELLPRLTEELPRTHRLRFWSAGCSTGEEPYTVSMLTLDAACCEDRDVSIFGSDISRRALAVARKAEYGLNALRSTPIELQRKYFVSCGPGRFRVADAVRNRVNFGQVNLLDSQNLAPVGRMDVIFCRNVMIYFEPEARRRVLRTFYDKLAEGGYLLLGHSENLINFTADFELVHLQKDLVYRKPRT